MVQMGLSCCGRSIVQGGIMIQIACGRLEICFSDKGELVGIFQNGESILDKRKEDFFLQVKVDGKSYTDRQDFVFEKAEKQDDALTLYYLLLDTVQIAVHLEVEKEFIRMYASFCEQDGRMAVREVSDCTFCLPAVKYESIETDRFHSPGQGACYEVTSENITFRPDGHVADMAGFITQEDMYSTTPDKGAGLLVVEREDGSAAVGFVPYCDRENFFPMTKVEEEGIYLFLKDKLVCDLARFHAIDSGKVYLIPAGSYMEVLEKYQRLLKTEAGIKAARAPEWFTKGAILETSASLLGGFQKAGQRLDEFYDYGVRTIYLMPCVRFERPSNYCTLDYNRIDEEYGTEEDFRMFVNKVHEKGMRILMDFVPQGTSALSPLFKEHPDWYEKDREGNAFPSHGWTDTRSLDWANPEVQRYFVEMGCYYVKTFGVDGYRVDAPHWKEPNYDRNLPYPASYTCFGSVRMLEQLKERLEELKPDVALMNEVWGVLYAGCTHAVCEYNIHWALYNTALGVFSGSGLQKWLNEYRYTQPEENCKAVFLETHDTRLLTPIAQKLRGAAVMENLVDLIVFMGYVPMIWHEELERRGEYYRKILSVRRQYEKELKGWADVGEIFAQDENVFVAARKANGRNWLFLVNFGSYPVKVTLHGMREYFGLREGVQYKTTSVYPAEAEIITGPFVRFIRETALHQSAETFDAQEIENVAFGVQSGITYWLEIQEA